MPCVTVGERSIWSLASKAVAEVARRLNDAESCTSRAFTGTSNLSIEIAGSHALVELRVSV